ncbi:MAG: hypothetical protein COY19_03170 [Candidatus Marinimicrobia bacterium CG_4_10_14_0_2_um_filter_48_9]|nr:MAG: hypothetical protein COY19_03170 [Candidatus Marinimicrobia bacterium CG_4_10_14_0_2_um_filter_48_9]
MMVMVVFVTLSGLSISTAFGQLMRPSTYGMMAGDSTLSGLIGTGISDIKESSNAIWLGSGHGISKTTDDGETFRSFSRQFSNISYGGVSAMAVQGDTAWFAFAIDSLVGEEMMQTGTGIARTLDGGQNWTLLPQPMDSLRWIYEWNSDHTAIVDSSSEVYSSIHLFGQVLDAVDVVTPIKNVTFDLAFDGKRLWASSFAGGLRKSYDLGDTWERVLLPWDDYTELDSLLLVNLQSEIIADSSSHYFVIDPVLHLNHRVFSVIAWGDTIWAGSAGGANFSRDGGRSWKHYSSSTSNMSGNWIVAMHRQNRNDGSMVIWASTVTTGGSEVTGLSYFREDEKYWYTTMPNKRFHNFASSGVAIYAAGEDGLFKSKDGDHFAVFPPIQSADGSSNIFSDAAYSVLVRDDGGVWVGTGDGLAITYNEGLTWQIEKAQAQLSGQTLIAFPNPFYPSLSKQLKNEGHLIIQYDALVGQSTTVKIFDWVMSEVATLQDGNSIASSGSQEIYWTGRNSAGQLVSNGTYFVQLKAGDDISWTKVMVIN